MQKFIDRQWAIGLCALIALVLGCQNDPPITVQEMPAWKTGIPDSIRMPSMPASGSTRGPRRMVVATAFLDNATWFFKLDSSITAVSMTEDAWRPFLSSIKFDDTGNPVWNLPEGWEIGERRPERFATLKIPIAMSDEPGDVFWVEMAISSLSAGQELVSNVNRWRGQMGMAPASLNQIESSLTKIGFVGGEFLIFDESTGNATDSPSQTPSGASTTAPDPLGYDAPPTWKQLAASMFTAAKFSKSVDGHEWTMSVTPMSATNTWQQSVASWLDELKLDADGLAPALEQATPVTVGGVSGFRIMLSSKEFGKPTALIGVRVERGERAWYFKMVGDEPLVLDSIDEFEQFLNSVRFR